MNRRYYVYTWDLNLQQFTPQIGVKCGPYSLWGLREPIRKLRNMGYSARRDDAYVAVTKGKIGAEEEKPEGPLFNQPDQEWVEANTRD